jgi:hypothetical protein
MDKKKIERHHNGWVRMARLNNCLITVIDLVLLLSNLKLTLWEVIAIGEM